MSEDKQHAENLGSSRCYASVGSMLEDISPEVAAAFYREQRIRSCFRASWFCGSFVFGYSLPQLIYGLSIGDSSRCMFWLGMVLAGGVLAYRSYRRLYA